MNLTNVRGHAAPRLSCVTDGTTRLEITELTTSKAELPTAYRSSKLFNEVILVVIEGVMPEISSTEDTDQVESCWLPVQLRSVGTPRSREVPAEPTTEVQEDALLDLHRADAVLLLGLTDLHLGTGSSHFSSKETNGVEAGLADAV